MLISATFWKYIMQNIKIGERLRQARESIGLTQKELGSKIGLTRYTILKYESGDIPHEKSFAITLERECGINSTWLLTGEGDMMTCMKPFTAELDETKSEIFALVSNVLNSGTPYADALYVNILNFHRALKAEAKINAIEEELKKLTDEISVMRDELNSMKSKIQSVEQNIKPRR